MKIETNITVCIVLNKNNIAFEHNIVIYTKQITKTDCMFLHFLLELSVASITISVMMLFNYDECILTWLTSLKHVNMLMFCRYACNIFAMQYFLSFKQFWVSENSSFGKLQPK